MKAEKFARTGESSKVRSTNRLTRIICEWIARIG